MGLLIAYPSGTEGPIPRRHCGQVTSLRSPVIVVQFRTTRPHTGRPSSRLKCFLGLLIVHTTHLFSNSSNCV